MKNTEEIWVPVRGFEDRYLVSNLGRVKTIPRNTSPKEIVLKQSRTRDGYLCIIFCNGSKKKNSRIHRVVLGSFTDTPLDVSKVVNHLDGNKHNNRLDNLEEVTVSQNAYHAYSLGLRCASGTRNGKAKTSEETILKVKEMLLEGVRVGRISKELNLHQTTVSHIKSGKMWGSVTGWSRGSDKSL